MIDRKTLKEKLKFRKRYKYFKGKFYFEQKKKPIAVPTCFDEERNFIMFLN